MMDIELLSAGDDDDEGGGADAFGVVIGVVTNNKDEEGLGRVKVKFPWLSGEDESQWARVATPMAGKGRGLYFLPEVEDEVLVAFEHGLMERPYVIGALWNGQDRTPGKNDDGKNNARFIRSRSGHTITLDDTAGEETITIVDKSEKNKIVMTSKDTSIAITSGKDLSITAKGKIGIATGGGDLEIACKKLSIKADEEVEIGCNKLAVEATQTYELNAAQAKLQAKSQLAVQCSGGVKVNGDALVVT